MYWGWPHVSSHHNCSVIAYVGPGLHKSSTAYSAYSFASDLALLTIVHVYKLYLLFTYYEKCGPSLAHNGHRVIDLGSKNIPGHHWRQPRRGCRGHPPNILVGGDVNGNIPANIITYFWI